MKKHLFITLAAVVALNLVFCGCNKGDTFNSSGSVSSNWRTLSLEIKAQALTANLQAQGFEVNRGFPILFGNEQCQYAIQVMGSCYGNNPLAPYVLLSLPSWPGEFEDPATMGAFGPQPAGFSAIYRFDPREAIVVLAYMPPPASYFGMQTYEFTRAGVMNTADPIYHMIATHFPPVLDVFFKYSPNPNRLQVFSSIGNSNNNVVIENQSGESFDVQRYFIISPDQFMERKMREALLQGVAPSPNDIFSEPIPQNLPIGLAESADDFTTWIRYANPVDRAAGDGWRNELPLIILRVRDTSALRPAEPYPPIVLDPKGGFSENFLQTDLKNLVAAVKNKWRQPGAVEEAMYNLQLLVDFIGPHCELRGMNCLGDTQDASYQGTLSNSMDNNKFYAVVGPLGTQTGNATYVNLSVYNAITFQGLYSVPPADLPGTADEFSSTVANTDKLFVYYFARDCSKMNLPAEQCFSITETIIPKGVPVKIAQRDYIAPGTERAADPNLLLMPVLIPLDVP